MGAESSAEAPLAVIVVNFRTAATTARAVAALNASTRIPHRVIVVDNGSGDREVSALRGTLGESVRLLSSSANLGFAGGANLGLREALRAGAQRVMLVNSDLRVAQTCLHGLDRAMEEEPMLGVVGPVVLSAGSPDRVESAGIRYGRWTARMRLRASGRHVDDVRAPGVLTVQAVSGAAMMIRREVLERVGLLDEGYFLYFEDLDFCRRAREAGFRIGCARDCFATHEGGSTTGPASPLRIRHGTRSHLRFDRRYRTTSSRLVATARDVAIVSYQAAYAFRGAGGTWRAGLQAVARGVRDASQ